MKRFICILLCAVMATSLCACGGDKGEVTVQSVAMICGISSVGRVDRFGGIVSPMSETGVQAAADSAVSSIAVNVGDEVKKGDVLFTYDTRQTSLELEHKQLELEKLKGTLEMLEDQRKEYSKLCDRSAGDEKRNYTLDAQENEVSILETNYNIALKQKEIEKLSALLKNSTVTSPVDGSVQGINRDGATDNNGNILPLISLAETGGFRIKGYVNENNASSIYEGMVVLLRSRVNDDTWKGVVSGIDFDTPVSANNESADGGNTSSKYPFYVVPEDITGLLLGQHVYIEPDYGQEEEADSNVIHMPESYINDVEGTPWIWAKNENGKLEKRTLQLGEYNADMGTYPIQDGLSAEDYIAFPDDTLCVGMTCVTYDEGSLSDDTGDNTEGQA